MFPFSEIYIRVSHIGLYFTEVAITTPLLREVIPSNSPFRKYTNKGFNANFEISLGGGKGDILRQSVILCFSVCRRPTYVREY